jgi:phosphoglycolate phosphatase
MLPQAEGPIKADLVIFDFDGTLFDSYLSVIDSITRTFAALLPSYTPPHTQIEHIISTGGSAYDVFRALHPSPSSLDAGTEELWVKTYRALYDEYAQDLVKPYPGARELLYLLREAKVPIAIVSNKGVGAIRTALERNGFSGVIPDDLVVGDNTPGAGKKPDPASFVNVVVPRLKEMKGDNYCLDEKRVLVVGDTVADINFAKNINAMACWCRYGQGSKEECEKLKPDAVVNSLEEVAGVLYTLGG